MAGLSLPFPVPPYLLPFPLSPPSHSLAYSPVSQPYLFLITGLAGNTARTQALTIPHDIFILKPGERRHAENVAGMILLQEIRFGGSWARGTEPGGRTVARGV